MDAGVANPPGPLGAGPAPSAPSTTLSKLWLTLRAILPILCSFGLTALVLANAYFQRQQFYPSVVYITKSNPSMAVIYMQAFVFVILFGKLMRKLFFGQLRAAEIEHVVERFFYVIIDTGLAFTVFKDDFSPNFLAFFTALLFLKVFHWLADDRVDFMERSPNITALFHIRIVSLIAILGVADINFITMAYNSILAKGPSVQLVFAFEYAILLTILVNLAIKWVLHVIDLYGEHPWEDKVVFMHYTEVVIDFIKDLANTDNVCIICREEMTANSLTKKLPCNHIFHTSCLRSWFQRQQTCPTCRLNILQVPGDSAQARQQARPQGAQNNGAHYNNNNNPQGHVQGPPPGGMPRPGQFPMFDPNMFMQGRFPFPVPPGLGGLAPPGAQQPRPGVSGTAPTGTPVTSQPTSSTGSTGVPPPFFPPMPPFFGMPFGVPPPLPPVNFSGLTDDEVRAMEGQERQHVEARVKCLRNIQILLDAAVMEMQQYSAVTARLPAVPVATVPTPAAAPASAEAVAAAASTANAATASTSSTAATSIKEPLPSTSLGARPKVSPTADVTEKKAAEAAVDPEKVMSTLTSELMKSASNIDGNIDPKEAEGRNAEQDEIRRRRLALFEQQKSDKPSDEESKKTS
eukprot:maker-scaffold310_size212938-snap-gene-1.19 protein:Tk03978 transcript:maker-scaffold310_size212938-snap-gene-1.19-mRNA-1 annotation:"GG11831"